MENVFIVFADLQNLSIDQMQGMDYLSHILFIFYCSFACAFKLDTKSKEISVW